MILDLFSQIVTGLQSYLISIPTDSLLGKLYVVFNLILQLFVASNGTSGSGGLGSLFS